MKQIADAAGVSRSAVSCVLNGYKRMRVSPENRERIIQLAKQMGYCRNEVATTIKTGKSKVIALAGELLKKYSVDFSVGIMRSLQKHGYSLKLVPLDSEKEQMAAVEELAVRCKEQMVAGVIVFDLNQVQLNYLFDALSNDGTPVIQCGFDAVHDQVSQVCVDIDMAAQLAIQHLAKYGHQRIGFVNFGDRPAIFQRHLDAYRKALESVNLKIVDELVLKLPFPTTFTVDSPLGSWLANVRPSAVFSLTEDLSFQILLTSARCGIVVPDDMSVVGFGNTRYFEYSIPPLTVVEAPHVEIGEIATENLIRIIDESIEDPLNHVVAVRLKERESVSSPQFSYFKSPSTNLKEKA